MLCFVLFNNVGIFRNVLITGMFRNGYAIYLGMVHKSSETVPILLGRLRFQFIQLCELYYMASFGSSYSIANE